MFIIPIGTKSSLALKPRLTLGLIAVNVVVAAVTIPVMLRMERNLFGAQRARLARQMELFLDDHGGPSRSAAPFVPAGGGTVAAIEDAPDPASLDYALAAALAASGKTPEDFMRFERILRARMDADRGFGADAALFAEWKRLLEREERIVEDNVQNALGLVPSRMDRIHTFITHLFVHAGIWHLLGNMLFLWVVGCLLEDTWGKVPFLVFYCAGGVFAGLAHSLQDTASTVPLIGASGAIAAAMGAFAIRHFFTRIKFVYFFLLFLRPLAGTFYLPAYVFLPFWFTEQVALHYLDGSLGGVSGVAYMAHIGGFALGFLTALAVRLTGFEERFLAPAVEKRQIAAGVRKDPRFDRACSLLERGRTMDGIRLFEELLAERPDDFNLAQDAALILRERGLRTEFETLADRALKTMIGKGRMEEAATLAVELAANGEGRAASPQGMLRIAKWLTDAGRYGDAHDLYRCVLRSDPPPLLLSKTYAALAKLLAERMQNQRDALALLEEARTRDLGPEGLRMIEELQNRLFPLNFTSSPGT